MSDDTHVTDICGLVHQLTDLVYGKVTSGEHELNNGRKFCDDDVHHLDLLSAFCSPKKMVVGAL